MESLIFTAGCKKAGKIIYKAEEDVWEKWPVT